MENQQEDLHFITLALEKPEEYLHIVKKYEEKLKRYIHRVSQVSQEEAEDILQEVFIKSYLHLREYNPEIALFSSWLYRITRNEAISAFRKKSSRPFLLSLFIKNDYGEEELREIADTADTHASFTQKEEKENLEKIIHSLPEKYRDVIILKYLEEKSYEEISDILKLPLGTVSVLLSRAKKLLAQKYSFYQ
jgi:RNA polymerase sigma-70 factor (ECF subfamily)